MRKFGLIGRSLEHSGSKEYFQQKFVKENTYDSVYENIPISDLKGFRDLILHDKALTGLNITIPYKISVLDHIDELDPEAEATRAVNCVKISRGENSIRLKGFNTDVAAFRQTITPLLRKSDKKALILGSGGAARAVSQALNQLDIDHLLVSRENKSGSLTYADISRHIISEYQLIINATPVGMFPYENQCPPLPCNNFTSKHLLYDLIYNPEKSLFLRKGTEAGARTKNGLEMLQLQAELSWKIWNH